MRVMIVQAKENAAFESKFIKQAYCLGIQDSFSINIA